MASRPYLLIGLIFSAIAFAQTPSSTSLTATPNPSNYGQAVTLTATVTACATGKVTFYDGVAMLGVATLSGTQAAMSTVLLPSGSRKLLAHYNGDGTYAASTSAALTQTVVAGTSLGLNPAVSSPTTTMALAVVVGDFNHDGKQDFAILTQSNSVAVYLGNGDGTFQAGTSYTVAAGAVSLATGDFNGDGRMDIVTAGGNAGTINILLGNGDGTFQAALNSKPGSYPTGLAVADFNGDGMADLALATSSGVEILLGNGDGTFKTAIYAVTTEFPLSVAVADLNGDGIADLVVTSTYQLGILLGNGDGTFQSEHTVANNNYYGYPAQAITGDFNGDGHTDIFYISYGQTEVLPGNGDGTFGTPVFLGSGTYYLSNPPFAVVADFNGDGKLDLALVFVASSSSTGTTGAVSLFPGNGDGTFGAAVETSVPTGVTLGAVGDFNGDGKADMVVASGSNTGYSVLLGGAVPDLTVAVNHGGGFTQGQQSAEYTITVSNVGGYASSGPVGLVATIPAVLTATSLSGAGWTCTLASLACSRDDTAPAGASYPKLILKVNVSNGPAGNVTSTFSVSGGGESNIANDFATDTTFLRYPSTTALALSPNPSLLGQAVALTATVTANATGRVDFYQGTLPLGSAPVAAGQGVFTTSVLPSGVSSLRAIYTGDSQYGPSTSATKSQTVTPVSDTGVAPYTSYPLGGSQTAILAADLNGDGKTDLVTANNANSNSSIEVLLGNGDGTFRPAVSYPLPNVTSYGGFSGVLGDFNSDGKPDVAVATSSGIFVFAGNGDGTFGKATLISSAAGYSDLATADFNGDGVPDLMALSSGAIVLFPGNGDGTFQPAITLTPSGSNYSYLGVADMNGDGKPDLVAAPSTDAPNASISVFLGNGDGTFQQPINTSMGIVYYNGITIGDFNGDGKPDVAVIYWVEAEILPGNGDGTFKAPIQSSITTVPGYLAVAGDFNGDGKLDIAYNAYVDNDICFAFGNGDGTFQLGPNEATDGPPAGIVLGDFNRDGKPDFAVAGGQAVDVFLGATFSGLSIASTHTGRFTAGQTGTYQLTVTNPAFASTSTAITVTDTLPYGLVATAIAGNGWTCTVSPLSCNRSDALASNQSYPTIALTVSVAAALLPSVVQNACSVALGSLKNSASDPTTIVSATSTALALSPSPSTLGQSVTLTATVTPGATGTVLFLYDGIALGATPISGGQAVLSTRALPAGQHSLWAVYAGDATHGSSVSAELPQTVNAMPTSGFSAGATYGTGATPMAVAAGDFNNDGTPDLVTANSKANTISVLLGNGDGTFGANTDYSAGTDPVAVVVADFNHDGHLDIAVADESGNSISILLGNGNGTFQPAIAVPVTNTPLSLAASDFNDDGRVDLVTFGPDGVILLLGNGDGTFQTGVNVSSYYSASYGVVGDFNGDGKVDILTSYGSLLLGNGDGTFQSTSISGFPNQSYIAAGDLNGDGKLDVIAIGYNGIATYLGNGGGTFRTGSNYSLTSSPVSLMLADVNGDGKLDAVTANASNNNISVFLGNGDGTLQPAVSYNVGTSPQGAAAANFTGDGRTDLAIANSGSNNVTVIIGVLTPVLTISSSHSDPFTLGQIGATYSITVKNNGPGATSGPLTVTDTLPAGFTATAISGTGWSCTLASLTCTNSTALGVGQSYSSITVTLNVTGTAAGNVVNLVKASGGGAVAANAEDPTSITGAAITIQTTPPNLQFTVDNAAPQTAPQTLNLAPGSHTIAVASTQSGTPGTQYVFTGWSDSGAASHTISVTAPATYTATFKTQYLLTVAAFPQSGGIVMPTSGTYYDAGSPMTLTATPNSPLTFTGWSGTTGTTNPLQITMNAPLTITAAFDTPGATCTMTGDTTASITDIQFIVSEALGVVPANNDLNNDGVVNIADVQKVLNSALHLGCLH